MEFHDYEDPQNNIPLEKLKICSGCNVRGNWEHKCHGKGCDCQELSCQVHQGKMTHKELMEIINE